MSKLRYFLYSCCLWCTPWLSAMEGFFNKPVVELCGDVQSKVYKDDFAKKYDDIAYSGESREVNRRAQQGLFNQRCTVVKVDETTAEVLVELPHVLLFNNQQQKLCPAQFWTLGKNVEPLTSQVEALVPAPVVAEMPKTFCDTKSIILTHPWYDATTQQTYAAGTRFVRIPDDDDRERYAVVLVDSKKGKPVVTRVPREKARWCGEVLTEQERRELVINLLEEWCSGKGELPYVLGGASFMGYSSSPAKLIGKEWWREGPPHGLDCSTLVATLAMIAGIPYAYKNTSTALKCGVRVKRYEQLQPGDLVVWYGHMVIVGKEDTVYEASGYASGYGCLTKKKLSERFEGIKRWADIFERDSLHLINRKGDVLKINDFACISLSGSFAS